MGKYAAQIFELFELDMTGTVLHFGIDSGDSNVSQATSLVGRNFFEEVFVPELSNRTSPPVSIFCQR